MRAPWVAATVLLSTLNAAVALAEPVAPLRAASEQGGGGGRQCGTPAPDPFEVQQLESALSTRPLKSGVGGTIKVAFHVIYSGSEGNLPQSRLDAQVAELNKAYAGRYGGVNTGYKFELASVDRTENARWFKMLPGTGVERQAKQALAVDVPHRLNIYTCKPGQNLLGWAYFPNSFPEDDWHHGVVIHYGSVPGGYIVPYNLGGTADHEVGHYLGLYHTFENGCNPPGDFVDDTPDEATPTAGCPEGKDTCPTPGLDPIHDYMDYSDDACYTMFTAGQDARMDQIVPLYRPSLLDAAVAQRTAAAAAGPVADGAAFRVGPNPFRDQTSFTFSLPERAAVSLAVYSVLGQNVATLARGELPAGEHAATLRAGKLPPGLYYAVLRVGGTKFRKTLVIEP